MECPNEIIKKMEKMEVRINKYKKIIMIKNKVWVLLFLQYLLF